MRFGPVVPESTWERITCDSRVQVVTTDDDGEPNGIEDMSRAVSMALRRLVEERFGDGCAFPGCGRSETLLHWHHIIHACEGGPTCPWNLVLLCWYHHKAVHAGGFRVRGRVGPGEHLEFLRPDGSALEPLTKVRFSDAIDILKRVRDELGP